MKKILSVTFLLLGLTPVWTNAIACDCNKNKGAAAEDSRSDNKAAENDEKRS